MGERLQLVKKLSESGTLKQMMMLGLLSMKVNFYYEVWCEYDILTRIHKLSSNKAKEELTIKFKADTSTIHRAIRFFTK